MYGLLLFFLGENLLLISFKTTFDFLYIFCGRKSFRLYSTVKKHIADGGVIVDMLALDSDLTVKVFLLNVDGSHLCGKILCFYSYGRKKVCKRSFLRCTHTTFHLCGIKPEECSVSLRADNRESFGIDSSLIQDSGKSMFCLGKLGTSLYPFIIEKSLVYKFRTTSLNSKIVLSESNLCLARVAILRYKIAGIACKHHVI